MNPQLSVWGRGAAPRKPAPRKPPAKKGKGGGLGVTKMANKVDDSLFEQAPAAPAPALPASVAQVGLLLHM